MAAITVLIVDKDDLFRCSSRQLCEINGGFQVVAEATSAADLVALAAHLRPDVVLVDMHLAELDGAETTRLLLAAQPDLVVILLAFAWDDEMLERARRSGARAWLAKDCAGGALFAAMRTGQGREQTAAPRLRGQQAAP